MSEYYLKSLSVEKKDYRLPNLGTILMVEDFLKKNRSVPIQISVLKKKLPKQVMHQTLKIVLEYLFRSGKVIYGPRGVQWIYSPPEHLKKMFKNCLEL